MLRYKYFFHFVKTNLLYLKPFLRDIYLVHITVCRMIILFIPLAIQVGSKSLLYCICNQQLDDISYGSNSQVKILNVCLI